MLWNVPTALLLLFGAIPLILFLHSLKPRGIKVGTTTLFLWERVLKEQALGRRLGWLLKKSLLLILQLLIAAALIAALGDPALLYIGAPAGDSVVVVDLSASMKAGDRTGTRFEGARRQFLSLVNELGTGRKMMVIGAGAQPRLLMPFTANKSRLAELGRSLEPTDAQGQVREAILFAHAFLKRGSPDRVVVISDGAFAGAEDFSQQSAHLRLIKVGGGRDNIGIVGFEMRRHPSRESLYELMVHVKNFTAKALPVPLRVMRGEQTLWREEIEIGADGRRVLIYPLEGSAAGNLVAQLDINDDFATDNRAYLAVSETPAVRLLYVGPGNPFLKTLFQHLPQIQMTHQESWEPGRAELDNFYDVIIFDRVTVPPLTAGNVILINTLAPNLPLKLQGKVRRPRVIAPLAPHPITEGLNLGDLQIREALRLSRDGEGVVLARSQETPLLFAWEKGKLRVVLMGFDLMASDLPLRVAFPVLFHNALQWLRPQAGEFPARSARAGNPIALYLPPAAGALTLTSPSGKKEALEATASPFFYADTVEAGIYSYHTANQEGRFAVNLFDEAESEIMPRGKFGESSAAKKSDQQSARAAAGFLLWPTLLIVALLLMAVEALLALRSGTSLYPLAIRSLAATTLVAALVNPKLFTTTNALDVVLGVDLSRSVGQTGRERASEIMAEAERRKNPDTRTGLLVFGREPQWEFVPRPDPSGLDFAAKLNRDQTDIQAALQAAVAQIGEGRQGKILLISDGNENRGETARIIPLLRAQGAQVWALPVSLARDRNELYVSDLILPRQVDSAEGFEIRAVIESLRPASGRIKLLRNGVLLREQETRFKPGASVISFRENLVERGSHMYELLVESAEDTLAENNLLQAMVEVRGPPRVLVLSSQKETQRFLSGALRVQGYEVVESSPAARLLTLPELSLFDLLILDNVPAFQLSHAKMETIEKYVRDLGGGLLVIGGSQSYGAGGYYRTPLERVLPVDMRPPARLDLPHVALLFVLDKSGSMGAGPQGSTKLDLAKAAAMAAADIMNPTDQIGILGFDAAWSWVLPFRPVGQGEWISEKLASMQSDGGTDMYKALVEAHRAIAAKDASIKHVLVLSDGLTDKMDFHSLVTRMAREGITVSTVSVGSDADVQLMADIAKSGKGRGYVALDPQTIPQIFTAETLLISRELLVEKAFTPRVVAPVGPLKGLARVALPNLRGYVLTYPKPRAELLMTTGKDPLLVAWRYGLGRVMAFTSDLSGRWGKEWVTWQGFPQWVSQLVRDTVRKIVETRMRTEFSAEARAVKITADFVSKGGDFVNYLKLKGNVTGPNQATEEKSFQQTAPGRYESQFTPTERGIYLVTLFAETEPGKTWLNVGTLPYIGPYPKEYRELKPNLALLRRLTEETGGEMFDPEKIEEGVKRLYTPTPGAGTRGRDLWWPLAGFGLVLFLLDLLMRVWPLRLAA